MTPTPLCADAVAALTGLVTAGRLRTTTVDLHLAERHVRHAEGDLIDAANQQVQLRNRFQIAVNAAESSGDALLAAYGYRRNTQQRVLRHVFDAVFVGTPAAMHGSSFEQMRRLRANLRHESVAIDDAKLVKGIDDAHSIVDATVVQLRP
jgi:methylphosphotriester-DNA--protein-cysteine methyltransferase